MGLGLGSEKKDQKKIKATTEPLMVISHFSYSGVSLICHLLKC